jgi:hypothetical protein
MKFSDFQNIMSAGRMQRYYVACSYNSKKAMTLYRENLKLSQELFTIISCFEIALRNSIDKHYVSTFGSQWLKDAAANGGIFNNRGSAMTAKNINDALSKLNSNYTHNKLVAELGFGFWRFMFASHQYLAGGQTLLKIFPNKPASSPSVQYNANFVFNQLQKINEIRNRVAHHEPICFIPTQSIKSTTYIRQHYTLIQQLFQWMSINERTLLYGLDHINNVCERIDNL